MPVFEVPPASTVFAREKHGGAPLVAGLSREDGAVLWVAAEPGQKGYERFPHLIHALVDLGLELPSRGGADVGLFRLLLSHSR